MESIEELKAVFNENVPAEKVIDADYVINWLKKNHNSRPATYKSLQSCIRSFGKPGKLNPEIVKTIIETLKTRSIIIVNGTKFSYQIKAFYQLKNTS